MLLVLPRLDGRGQQWPHCFVCSCFQVCMDSRCSHSSLAKRAACLSHRRSAQGRLRQAPVTCFSQSTGALGKQCMRLALRWLSQRV